MQLASLLASDSLWLWALVSVSDQIARSISRRYLHKRC